MMLSESTEIRSPVLKQKGVVWDPVSQTTISLSHGKLILNDEKTKTTIEKSLSSLPIRGKHIPTYLKFKYSQNKNLLINPSGHFLTCKSERLQQCEMNMSFSHGIHLWDIYCSGNCLLLTIGVRGSVKKKQYALEFTAQSSLKISFKLDLEKKSLNAWVTKAIHQITKNIKLGQQNQEWTPFIRIKGNGVSLFLDNFSVDPEQELSSYNLFGKIKPVQKIEILLDDQQIKAEKKNQQSFDQIDVLDANTLLIRGKSMIRILRRSKKQKKFNCNLSELTSTNKIRVEFQREELQILQLANIQVKNQVKSTNYISKNLSQWQKWAKNLSAYLDQLHAQGKISQILFERIYQIILTKIQSFKLSQSTFCRLNYASQFDRELAFGINSVIFYKQAPSFEIPRSIALNNAPSIQLDDSINKLVSTDHFIVIVLSGNSRISIFNRENVLFKVVDISLKKGIKKQNELNQFKKQLEQLQATNSSEPSIYKILKNCLKYADKVKPPEKIIKKLQEKSKNKQQKKEPGLQPDKSILNTLISMGFGLTPSRKALIECKNSSLEDAIDLILKKYINQPQQIKAPSTSSATKQWSCEICTLVNKATATTCEACTSPKPVQKIQENIKQIQQGEKVDAELPQQIKQEEIISSNIEGEQMQNVFAWQSGFSYAPIILAGVFDKKIRIRLIGPNPKYYSYFYYRDEQFIDLSNYSVNHKASEIDQKPIRYLFHQSATLQEQKQMAYGWISIQDIDIEKDGQISTIHFFKKSENNNQLVYSLQIEKENKSTNSYLLTIYKSQIYEEKLRSLKVTPCKQKNVFQQKVSTEEFYNKEVICESNEIPEQGYLKVSLLSSHANQKIIFEPQVVKCSQIIEKSPVAGRGLSLLPLNCLNSQKSVQMSTHKTPLCHGKRPLILRHCQNKEFSVSGITLQKVGKNATFVQHIGYFWLSKDPSKIPLAKYEFRIPKGVKKTYIGYPADDVRIANYISIQLLKPAGGQDDLVMAEELYLSGVYGESYDCLSNSNLIQTKMFDKDLSLTVTDQNDKESSQFNFKVMIQNNCADLGIGTDKQIQRIVKNQMENSCFMDLSVIVKSNCDRLRLKNIQLKGWTKIGQKSVQIKQNKSIISQAEYRNALTQFINTGSLECLSIILNDSHKQFRQLLVIEKFNLTQFFINILNQNLQRIAKFRYSEFIKKFSSYIIQSSKAGNLSIKDIIAHTFQKTHTCLNLSELAFDLLKLFPCQQQAMKKKLSENIHKLQDNKGRNLIISYQAESSKSSQRSDQFIYSRFLVQKGNIYRKFIIDLFNVYSIRSIGLNFQKSQKKAPMRIKVFSFDQKLKARQQFEIFYSDSVLQQLTMEQSSKKNINSSLNLPITASTIKSRYLIIQICFAAAPANPSIKQISKMPQKQIIPEISGDYIGEADNILDQFLLNIDSLVFLKKTSSINKFSINKKGFENYYYFMGDGMQIQSKGMMEKKELDSQAQKQMKYIISSNYLILDDLFLRGTTVPSQDLVSIMVQFINHTQRCILVQKTINYLRKVAKNQQNFCKSLLKYKINSQGIFYQIFKESCLQIKTVVNELKQNTSLIWNNAILFSKSKTNSSDLNQLILAIYELALKLNKIQDIVSLFQKFGWIDNQIIDQIAKYLIRTQKSRIFKTLLRSCKDNNKLSVFVSTLLKGSAEYQYFIFGLDELKSPQRTVKQNEIQPVIRQFIEYIDKKCESIDSSFEQTEIHQQFTCISNNINHFQIKQKKLVVLFIQTFKKLPNKRMILRQFLNTEPLKSQIYSEKIIQISLKMLSEVLQSRLSQLEIEQSLSLVYDIFVFLFRNEVDLLNSEEQSSNLAHLNQQNKQKIYSIFANLLVRELNIGGKDNIKICDAFLLLKISVVSCISNIISKNIQSCQKFELKNQELSFILRWLFFNSSVSDQNRILTSKWQKVENTAWKIIQKCPNLNLQILKNQINQFNDQYISNFYNTQQKTYRQQAKLIYSKMCLDRLYRCLDRLINYFIKSETSQSLVKTVVFQQIIQRIIDINKYLNLENQDKIQIQTQNHDRLLETQFANEFTLQDKVKEQPKDWLIYKNGAKNSVYQFQYPKSTSQSHQLVLKLKKNKLLSLSKIIIGFQYKSNNDQTSCIPSQILVQFGQNLKDLKFIGKMFALPDDHFINYSVRVFGININQCSFSKLFKKLQRMPQAKYIRFTISCKNRGSLDDALLINTDKTKQKLLKSSVNFLSIQGYECGQAYENPQISSMVNIVKTITDIRFKKCIGQIFENQTNIQLFNQALPNIGLLMKNEQYQKYLHKFVMRICEVNTLIGDQTIKKYLTHQNSYLCAKIVAQIILANSQYFTERLTMLHQFIFKSIQQQPLNKVQAFMDRFCQILSIATQQPKIYKQKNRIYLAVTEKAIIKLIDQQNKTQSMARFLSFILSFDNEIYEISLDSPREKIYKMLQSEGSIKNTNKQILISLVIGDKSARSWFMKSKQLENIYQKILNLIKDANPEKVNEIVNYLDTLSELCLNSNIKSIVNKNKYNLQIFKKLLQQQKLLTTETNSSLRNSFVDFIIRSVLNTENQNAIGELLKQSLMTNIVQSNQSFVGQVFLPILNSYNKISISIIPYEKSEQRIVVDHNSLSIPTSGSMRQDKHISAKSSFKQTKFRLPSNILTSDLKQEFFNELKSKNKIESGQFNLAFNHNNSNGSVLNTIQSVMMGKKSLLILLKLANSKNNDETILGIYCHSDGNAQTNFTKNWNEKCSLFLAKTNQRNLQMIDIQSQIGKKMYTLHMDSFFQDSFDSSFDQKILQFDYNGVPFAQIVFTDGLQFSSSHFSLGALPNINLLNMILLSAEYWQLQSFVQMKKEVDVPTEQYTLTSLLFQSTSFEALSFVSNKFQTKSSLKYLRPLNIYEFPSSITVAQFKQAIQILKCRIKIQQLQDLKLYLLNDQNQLQKLDNDTPLINLTKKNGEKSIMDVFIEVDDLQKLLNFTTNQKSKMEYLPRKGILKYFQENNGINSMIKVLKKSIQSWNNAARKQKWSQYVVELEKFSNFPHFFGMYLKDNETFDLLFKLLSGLPDTQSNDKRWEQIQAKSSQKLLKIVSEILYVDKSSQFRQYALKHDFFETILQRLRILTGMFKRQYKQNIEQDKQEETSPSKNMPQDDGTKQIKKKKGVGYGNDGSSNTKWMKGVSEADLKKQFEVTEIILNMIQNFIDFRNWKIPQKLLDNIYQSALLPFLEDSLRAGTLLEISKHPTKFRLVFKILQTLSRNQQLVPILMRIPKNYQPKQIQPINELVKSLQSTSTIFLSCLKQNKESTKSDKDKVSEQLANLIIQTSKALQEAIQKYNQNNEDQNQLQEEMKNILELPMDKQYRILLKDLRFDYIDMKDGSRIKHHYSSNFSQNYTPNQNKMIRLAQQLADISTALPYQHTNAVYVRCDKDRVDFMQALIMGSNGTPYGHGAFLFDVYFDDNYPNGPPKVNLTTTGHGKVRFNPNLYACGKVCLSLLGTWRGSASQNWDPKVSTLLQVLLSIQAIIMSQQVYFNQPGFQNEQGTTEGQKKNEAYSNIVRYSNLKFAMIQNIRNPPKGFQTVIRRHFYIKRDQIMEECKKWLLYAQKRPANYVGLVNDHNNSWSNEFKKSKTQYKDMLQKAIGELQQQFKKLQPPSIHDIVSKSAQKKKKKRNVTKDKGLNLLQKLQKQQGEQIDVTYEESMNTNETQSKEIDINDQKVKDRWSRYIGAMGVDAVSKQSKADILVFGLDPMSLQVVKNLVMSGCRRLTICDSKKVTWQDLSGGFFYDEKDIGRLRIDAALHKIKQLNVYVKVDATIKEKINIQDLKQYHIVFISQMALQQQFTINQFCRKNSIKFISAENKGAYCRLLNDLGDNFEVLDKNGQQPVQLIIKNITCQQNAVVTLLDGLKHPYEDGEAVIIKNVEGMQHKQDETKSINQSLHKIKSINAKSFMIGDTTNYKAYIRNGTVKNIKTPVQLKYKSMKEVYENIQENIPIDENLQFYDFTKMEKNKIIHNCFASMDQFIKTYSQPPKPWNISDAEKLFSIFKKLHKDEIDDKLKKYVMKFSFTCSGYLPPLAAYFGGYVSQQIIKAITQKYKPTYSVFYMDSQQIIPEFDVEQNKITESIKDIFNGDSKRLLGLQIVVGHDLLAKIKNSKLFMIGAGAIGCQLLKNFAMIGLGSGEKGKITLTDPDHIENSNLNRQFLFRQKHISKPKSRTAAASVLQMNPSLKGHISPLQQRVSDKTKQIFSNTFFQSLTFVANALDNVAARRYVDQRCVQNKVPLFESGTLGPKGHIQVILPYKTESYGSQNDPVEEGQIPHCTLKMFPEQTLHCVEWARDIFGKKFSLQPKAFEKIKDKSYKPEKEDIKSLNECLIMANKGPKSFDDCIAYAIMKFYKYFRDDIIQLLYTYPLDAKTKNGEPFWKLPKRPPTPVKYFDESNLLHCIFVSSMAVLIAKIYKIPYPKNFRQQKERRNIAKLACKIQIPEYVPSDQKAKQILKESTTAENQKKQADEEDMIEQKIDVSEKNQMQLHEQFLKCSQQTQLLPEEFEKDDDQNGHIDFIYSMANLRALNYKLDQMDWITTKLKAGRIVPALSTTTTCVAGLQTLQICKYLRNLSLQYMRNSFLNLAVPSLQMSEPGEVIKTKLTQNLQVNLWDRWQVPCKQETTFEQVYDFLKNKYGLNPIGVQQGMSRIDISKSEAGKKQFLKSKIVDKLDKQQSYIDIAVLFTKSQQDDKILQNVPPIRLNFTE